MTNTSIPENSKRVAIVGGTGSLGSYITREFLSHKEVQVRVVTRQGSDKKNIIEEFKSNGAEIFEVDYGQNESLNGVFGDIDVVICALGGLDTFNVQDKLMKEAINSKVKLFIPAEFGIDVTNREDNFLFLQKIQTRKVLEKSGLSYIYYLNGYFIEHVLTQFHGINTKNHTAEIIGKGDTELAVISMKDIAKFVYNTYYIPSILNSSVFMVGEITTFNKVLKDITKVTNKKFNVTYVSLDKVQKTLDDSNAEFFQKVTYILRKDTELGYLKPLKNSNDLVPDLKFTSVSDYAKSTLV